MCQQRILDASGFVLKPGVDGFQSADLKVGVGEEPGVHGDTIVLPEKSAATLPGAGKVAEDGQGKLLER